MATARSLDFTTTDHGPIPGSRRTTASTSLLRRGLAVTFGLVVAAAAMLGTTQAPASAAVVAGVAEQCNGIQNAGGQAVECEVTIENYLDVATGLSSSVVVARSCTGAANTELLCTTLPVSFPTATTEIDQCNAAGQGGGATVTCRVTVVNNIIGDTTLTPATVNQCVGSGAGGGTQPTLDCTPVQSTTNATITQCNGAANGGGDTRRVTCVVRPSTQSTALPVSITQCNNGNVTAPGSLVTCTASLTHRLLPAGTVIPTPTSTATPVPTPTTTPTSTPTNTPVPTPSATATATPTPTSTPTPTASAPTPSASATPVPSTTPTPSSTPTSAPTQAASPVVPAIPTSTPTPAATIVASPLIPAGGTGQAGALAETGMDALPVFLIAAGALLAGGVLLAVVLIRRRSGSAADRNPTRRP
ncbi:hypothetical protein [Cryobacterium sp. AP23]